MTDRDSVRNPDHFPWWGRLGFGVVLAIALFRAMLAKLPATTRDKRDHALLLLGFAAALRRSEIVALDGADVVERREGLVVNVRRSKTDQEGRDGGWASPYGSNPATCPVRALEA